MRPPPAVPCLALPWSTCWLGGAAQEGVSTVILLCRAACSKAGRRRLSGTFLLWIMADSWCCLYQRCCIHVAIFIDVMQTHSARLASLPHRHRPPLPRPGRLEAAPPARPGQAGQVAGGRPALRHPPAGRRHRRAAGGLAAVPRAHGAGREAAGSAERPHGIGGAAGMAGGVGGAGGEARQGQEVRGVPPWYAAVFGSLCCPVPTWQLDGWPAVAFAASRGCP